MVGFLLLFGLIALWSLETPRYAAPDEPVQAVKAAATAHGQFIGRHQPGTPAAEVQFQVPATIARGTNPVCVAFRPQASAACLAPWHTYPGTVTAGTYVGRYPPLYYLLVGLPSLFVSGTSVLFWMRLVSAAICAVFLCAAFVFARRLSVGTVLGAAIATTPMVLFIGGVVNPSGLEISSALCLWTAGLALATGAERGSAVLVWTVVSAGVLVSTRGLSPLLCAVIVLSLAAVARRDALAGLVRRRDVRIGAMVVGCLTALATAWIVAAGSLTLLPSGAFPAKGASNLSVLHESLMREGLNIRQMVGVFGWLDTYLPAWSYRLWYLALLGTVLGVVLVRAWRIALVVGALAFATVAIPTLLAYSQARQLGYIGAGRYVLPIAVGVPVLAAFAWGDRVPAGWTRRIVVPAGAALALVHVAAFVQALHRYRTGVRHPLWVAHAPWSPPIPAWLAVLAYAGLQLGLLAWWLSRVTPLAQLPMPFSTAQPCGRANDSERTSMRPSTYANR